MKIISDKIIKYALKKEDMENRLCRNNVRILGLPTCCEGSHPVGFMEKWFVEIIGKKKKSTFFAIERTHRMPYRVPGGGETTFL